MLRFLPKFLPKFVPKFVPLTRPDLPRIALAVKAWALSSGVWWATSIAAHAAILSAVVLLVGNIQPRPELGEAPAFEARVDTELDAPALEHFELGEAPLEPTELNTETLSLVDAPSIEAAEPAGEAPDGLGSVGGGLSGAAGGIGGLDQFAVKAIGPGPLVRGGGLGAGGAGKGPGSGGDGSGFGARGDSATRKAMLGGYGGTKASERAVAAALNWLARHQNPDGSWSLDGYVQHCKGQACAGVGNAKSDVAATAMALLPFLAAGQTHQTRGPYRRNIDLGLAWIIRRMQPNGDLRDGATMYTHGLATITLCEAYALSHDSRLRIATEAAVRFIEAAQIPATGGWHYQPPPEATLGDTSVVGWQVMALKSAQMAGLQVSDAAIAGAHKWLKAVAKGKHAGTFAYNPSMEASPAMTAVGLLCTQYLGTKRDDPRISEGMAYLMGKLPNAEARDTYYWYYATQVMHNLPGPEWDTWNRQMRRVLIESQVKEGCAAGSWDPGQPTPDPWGEQGGRIMITSLCCLTLEVYYRYLPLYKLDGEPAPAAAESGSAAASK